MLTHLYEVLLQRAEQYPWAVALGGQHGLAWQTLTSRQLLALVDRVADDLAAHGVRAHDRVVLWLPNHWRTPVYLFALWKLGAIIVPFDREMNPEAAADIIASVEPRCLLVGYDERPAWTAGQPLLTWQAFDLSGLPAAPHGWSAAPARPGRHGPAADAGISAPQPAGGTPWCPPAEELAGIFFTSGTTGKPKGCMITHANLCSQVESLVVTIPMDSTCRIASLLPLSHLYELSAGLLYPLSRGTAIHYVPSRRGPDIVRVLHDQRITHMVAVPQLLTSMGKALDEQLHARLPRRAYAALLALAERLPLTTRHQLFWFVHRRLGGCLRLLPCGGAALPAETHRLWERLGVRVVEGYGTSECSPVVASGAADGSTPLGSVGKALPGVELRLSPEGELLVRGPNVMRGYWKDPERTAEVLHDGWYATGDLARIDETGNVWLLGRARDLIVLPSGMKVWPQDVEAVLRDQAEVKDAAVLAVPTPGGGATLHAYLIPNGATPGAETLNALVARGNARLAQHQRLASASWWPEADFPRTTTLKLRRNRLPLPSASASVRVQASLSANDPVSQAIAGQAHLAAVAPTQTLAELGLDSLGLVELAVALEEKTDRQIGDGDLRLEMTVAQVHALLDTAPRLADATSIDHAREGAAGPGETPDWPYRWGHRFRWLGFPIDLLYRLAVTRTTVLGAEHLAKLPERLILAGVHRSFSDVPLIYYGLRHSPARAVTRRLVVASAATGMLRFPVYGRWAALAFGLYPLRRTHERDVSLRGLTRLAEHGHAILIFPQGVHTTHEHEQADEPAVRFRPGVVHLAATLGATVVPFGLAGSENIVPPIIDEAKIRRFLGIPLAIRRGPLAIAFGPPLTMRPGEALADFTLRLQTACYGLATQAEAALGPHTRQTW